MLSTVYKLKDLIVLNLLVAILCCLVKTPLEETCNLTIYASYGLCLSILFRLSYQRVLADRYIKHGALSESTVNVNILLLFVIGAMSLFHLQCVDAFKLSLFYLPGIIAVINVLSGYLGYIPVNTMVIDDDVLKLFSLVLIISVLFEAKRR